MKIFTRKGRALLLLSVVVIGVVGLSGCGGGSKPSELVGRWVEGNGSGSMELFKDGTGVSDGESVTWKVENKRFVIQSSGSGRVFDYKISGYELVLISDDKDSVTFVKKEKLEAYKKKKAEEERKEEERIKKEEEQRIKKLSSYFTDSRNGQKYRAVKIGNKTWMAQNLNYQTGKSWCYNNDESNCKQYGRLYDWNTARTACPSGWHLPSRQEWNDMVAEAGGVVAGRKLKSAYGWDENGNGTDDYGFSALTAGIRNTDGEFLGAGNRGLWWTATDGGSGKANFMLMNYDVDRVYEGPFDASSGVSVRCIAD